MAKKKNKTMLLVGAAALIGFFMYKKKKDAENEEFVLPPKSTIPLVRSFAPKNTLKKPLSKRGANVERIGNFENIQ